VSIETIDLNLLQVFHLVVGERSVARAARRLHVTPSAVSNALARLRDLLGDPIVTRKGRGIVPTPRATELAPIIARTLAELDAALFAAPFDPATCTRRFTLAIADPGQLAYVPRIAKQLAIDLPKAQLRVVGIDALVSLGDLGSSEIDVHIGVRGQGPGLHTEPLIDETTVLIAQRRHRAKLETLRHVQVEMVPGRNLRDPAGEAYRRANVRREIAITVPTFAAAAAVVAATDLVATVPLSFAKLYGSRLGFEIVRGAAPVYRVQLVLSWHDRTHSDPASIAFRAAIKEALGRAIDRRATRAVAGSGSGIRRSAGSRSPRSPRSAVRRGTGSA
jgi:DNA-binding transcriptional LysR family regulator